MSITQKEERRKHHHPLILLFETLLILVVFNASSYFGTTIYAKSIDFIGVALTIFLLAWIWVNSRFRYNYGMIDLGLTTRFVSRRQWRIIFAVAFLLYFVAFTTELVFPSEVKGEVTLTRLFLAAVFTLTFGPIFEELLFRGYLFRRSQDALHFKVSSKISTSSIFSGLVFGLWHFPTPIILIYFNDPIIAVYGNLLAFVLAASVMGIILGEGRRRTKSILPGVFLHFCANSIYMITLALRLF
ncbi:MAG: CPBP family intramembrane metalloprotease [Candidatus Bathyarchaeota archaeon]|nr:CPBP family intramembrane metalloprotease [Candidatus Bathyarchaeota archaeon]